MLTQEVKYAITLALKSDQGLLMKKVVLATGKPIL